MSQTIVILSDEHQIILRVIAALEKKCDELKSGVAPDQDFFRAAVDFIRDYADELHHAKEEKILFVEFEKNSESAHCNPVPQMLVEHEQGRAFVRGMMEALEKNDSSRLTENTLGYAALLREHIMKEDNILYPMIDQTLGETAMTEIFSRFAKIDQEKSATCERQLAFAEKIGN